jgi:hypothetical protein
MRETEEHNMGRVMLAGLAILALTPIGLTVAAQSPAVSKDVTFSKDVAPILYENCVYCHRPGEIAPFSMMTYKDTRPWARSIRQAVTNRRMPPWLADPHFSQFSNDRLLSERDLQTIVSWIDGGAVEGNPADMPSPPQFTEGWKIGTPDLVLTMDKPFEIQAKGDIAWVNIPSNDYVFPDDVWVQAIEIRPGNRAVVHHAVAGLVPPEGTRGALENLHLYAPGLDAMVWRDGYGKLIKKGSRVQFQMHYNAIGKATTDQSKVGFKFAKKPVHTPVHTTIVSNTSILIPPMVHSHEAIAAFQFPVDARVHGLRPHMHLRAKTGTASLIEADGSRRVLLHIPHWDDAWQNYYILSKPLDVKQGSILEYVANYDNSPANPLNPDPKSPVAWGQQIWEEMHSVYLTWTETTPANANDHAPIQIPSNKAFTTGVIAAK